jgi:hypothetical protein
MLPQAQEEYYVCKWSINTENGALLLLLGGKNGLLQILNTATGYLEGVSWMCRFARPSICLRSPSFPATTESFHFL